MLSIVRGESPISSVKGSSMKKKILAIAAAFSPLAVFAEGESSTPLQSVITDVQSGVTTMIGQILPAVGAIVVSGLAFWGLRALVRWARSYFGK